MQIGSCDVLVDEFLEVISIADLNLPAPYLTCSAQPCYDPDQRSLHPVLSAR